MNGPTLAGFTTFVYSVMQIPALALPDTSASIGYAFNIAMMTVNRALSAMGCPPGSQWSIYAMAVYNLAGSLLINFVQDQPGRTYFADLRKSYNIGSVQLGVVSSASDNGTGTTLLNPDFMRGLTLSDLQRLKDPWGRLYLETAQQYGSIVGIS